MSGSLILLNFTYSITSQSKRFPCVQMCEGTWILLFQSMATARCDWVKDVCMSSQFDCSYCPHCFFFIIIIILLFLSACLCLWVLALVSQLVLVYVSVSVSAVLVVVCVCIREWRVLAFFRFCVLALLLFFLLILIIIIIITHMYSNIESLF